MLIFLVLTSWTTETVMADSSLLEVPVIAIDASGNPYILTAKGRFVYPYLFYSLFLYSKSNENWIADTFELYESNTDFPDLTIDKDNRLFAIYSVLDLSDTTWYLIVASKDSIGWSKDTVEARLPQQGLSFCCLSIATDALVRPHIAYDYYVDPYPRGFYAFLDDSIWQKEIIDSCTNAYCCAIDVDSQNQPHISYFRMGDNLWYAKKIDSIWYYEEVDHTNYASWWTTSICIGPDDLPGIAYKDPNSYEVKYAYYNGISWHIDIVDSFGGAVETQKALDIDSMGKPYFIYDGGAYNSYLAYKDTGAWHKEILPLTPLVTKGWGGALRIGHDGTIHIARIATNDDYTYSEIHYIYGTPEGIEEESQITNPESNIPNLEVYPNPFSKLINISFGIGQSAKSIELKIYDVAGRLVKDFSRFTLDALRPTLLSWDGTNDIGQEFPTGVYFIRLESDKTTSTKKIIKFISP
jgi:hypothetical protein